MKKPAKTQPSAKAASSAPAKRPSQHPAAVAKPEGTERSSKQARVIAMLQSPRGATIAAMMKTTGWQQHSVRGFLAGVVRKRLKLNLASEKAEGNRVYKIARSDGADGQSKRRSA
jgi:uncharacterized protein DUF3489